MVRDVNSGEYIMPALLTSKRMLAAGGLGAAVILTAVVAVASRGADAANIGGTIVVASYGGIDDKNHKDLFFDPFTKATGVQFQLDPVAYDQVAKLHAQEAAGNVQYSLVEPARADAAVLGEQGLLEPLPQDLVDKANKVLGPGKLIGNYAISHAVSASSFVCLADFKPCPTNAKEFFDTTNFPGRRGMYADGWLENIIYALEADGVDPKALFPLDLDRAFKKLDEIKPHINVFWKTGDQVMQIVRDKEVDMTIMWDGRANTLAADGTPIQLSDDGAMMDSPTLAIPKGAPNKDAALAFISWWIDQAEAQGEFMNREHYGEPNPDAFKYVKPEVANMISTAPGNFDKLVQPDLKWVEDHQQEAVARWTDWLQN
ncbi:MAG TPA: extracellular solute-binding protein [Bauldia sp.]|nr:extracellular solute-binding protein [Bauldia sp.]